MDRNEFKTSGIEPHPSFFFFFWQRGKNTSWRKEIYPRIGTSQTGQGHVEV